MSTRRTRSLDIPMDNEGMLGRECPRCIKQFSIDIELYMERGFMNLRCPYCMFISELDNFTTGEQREYLHSTLQNFASQTFEQLLNDELGNLSGSSSGDVSIELDFDEADFGRVPTVSPELTTDTKRVACEDCEFSFGIAIDEGGECPVCR